MLRSMTGFGNSQTNTDDYALSVEIKSVNNKGLRISVKLPEDSTHLEPTVDAVVRKHMLRGSVFLNIRLDLKRPPCDYVLNVHAIKKLSAELRARFPRQDVPFADILKLPGAVVEIKTDLGEKLEKKIVALVTAAVRDLTRMREREGRALEGDFRRLAAEGRALVRRVRKLHPRLLDEYRETLLSNVAGVLDEKGISVAKDDVIRELTVFAERSNIQEEITRLVSHFDQFDRTVRAGGAVGRKLEFIAQEMQREANTMGAKTQNAELRRIIVDLKIVIDKMREQVLNVE